MGRRHRRAARVKTARQNHSSASQGLRLTRLLGADRRALLTGTALASTLLIAVMAAPTPAQAIPCVQPASPNPINFNSFGAPITCVNTVARTGDAMGVDAIRLDTGFGGSGRSVSLNNSGDLTTSNGHGIQIYTYVDDSGIDIINTGDIDTARSGIVARSYGNSPLSIVNSGTISGATAYGGIRGSTRQDDSTLSIINSGDITLDRGAGITGRSYGARSDTFIENTAAISGGEIGIFGSAGGADSTLTIVNSGDIRSASSTEDVYGIYGFTDGANNALTIVNSADIWATATDNNRAFGIRAAANATNSPITIINSGVLSATSTNGEAFGIFARTVAPDSPLSIVNSGDISAVSNNGFAFGIFARTFAPNSPLSIVNSGNIWTTSTNSYAFGIYARTAAPGSTLSIVNSGDVTVTGGVNAYGILAETNAPGNTISINNSAKIHVTSGYAVGIRARTVGLGNGLNIVNSGDVRASTTSNQYYATGIVAFANGQDSPITIDNSGSIYAEGRFSKGIYAYSDYNNQTTITNTGEIGASTHRAVDVKGAGTADIWNAGTITGFVDLTDQDDTFTNQSGGVFETKMTSLFGGGSDLFRNESGGTVHALRDGSAAPSFEGLERFENKGLISTVDGSTGDNFTISNTVGGKDLDFVASGNSRLAVDASLGGAGSTTDTFTIEGNVSGKTKVTINNTNNLGGEFNPTGIKIITVTGATPNANAFTLDAPVDAGFFDYDLFFTPTGSGFWSLKSFPGAGAQLLPQLVTAAQDIWHQGSSTWFDRTADLRVLVNGGGAPAESYGAANDGIAPAVWVRGSGGWLDRDSSGSTSSNGRTYKFDLDRQLDTMDFQMGLDLGSRDVLSQGDALVFGLLGGFVHGDLDYDNINRNFDYDGGQVGIYATYMKGGLFVDTLLTVHLMELDANGALGFPNNDLDATTVGLRSDAGYRFGSFGGGAFLEPLATLEVTWADIDGFALGGNSVKFDDDANVRGRLGLRAGTTMEAWEGTMMEPFVTGSLWGNLSGENQATLASNGSTFRFEDDLDDVWGEVSAGVNFFNFSQTTSLFAKVDVTFGDDVSGVGGKAGMRVAW